MWRIIRHAVFEVGPSPFCVVCRSACQHVPFFWKAGVHQEGEEGLHRLPREGEFERSQRCRKVLREEEVVAGVRSPVVGSPVRWFEIPAMETVQLSIANTNYAKALEETLKRNG